MSGVDRRMLEAFADGPRWNWFRTMQRVRISEDLDRPDERDDVVVGVNELYVGPSPRHGKGVFAGRDYGAGELLEQCPVLFLSGGELKHLERTSLHGYVYEWDDDLAFALGFGSLYNHSSDPSAEYELDDDLEAVCIRALRAIAPGEEITICYADEDDLWFDPDDEADAQL